MRFLALVTLLAGLCAPALAQDQINVVFTNSDPVVAVHSNFRGQAVTLFGNIETPPKNAGGAFSVIVLVQGPTADWRVQEKRRQLGLVLNSASARYDRVPSYYAILTSSPLEQIANADVLAQPRLRFAGLVDERRAQSDAPAYDAEFVRLMLKSGHFLQADRGVVMLSPTAFSVRVPIASDVINGPYLARALIVRDGEIVAETTTRFTVRTQGFERYVAEAARGNPVVYGLATIMLALATGWLGGVLFRR
ncbi:hypothetical protein GCM10007913_02230 [Devosia yakushimensis]|uniref:Transmembrane protein n=1 Tax=Devosia yakushimensis TaxID=470028 RepID=A0ABQ5UCL0_9HYPH|nr:TIGR02186 family protein [Devosia yakushimensis]GLQ08291.1 hypothetical protein GCM10007913_02230 [Devosia yakushimensis]